MRILHISPSYKPAYRYGGPIISVSRLAEEQVRVGAEVWVFTTTANGKQELAVPIGVPQKTDGVRVQYFRRWTGDHGHFSPGLLWAFWREARSFQVVHVHSWWNWVAFGAVLICRLRGVQAIISPRGMLSPYTLRGRLRIFFQKNLGRWLLAKSLLHATSEQEIQELQALHPGLPVVQAPNIVYFPDRIPAQNRATGVPLQVLFLSRIDPKKGLDALLRALAQLPQNSPAWQLLVGGGGADDYLKKMQALAEQLGLSPRIHWLGWVQGDVKWDLLAQSDLLVLPSHHENFANAVLEALAMGTPVVVGKQVGLSGYIAENDFGWRTEPNPEALTSVLLAAFADQEKQKRIRQTAPAAVRADFEPGKVVQQYFDLYRSTSSRPTIKIIFRRPQSRGFFSIERSFGAVWPALTRLGMSVERVVAVCESKGWWPRLRILAQMAMLRADVFHLTGDIHFAALTLPGRKTILTVHDCGFLRHPNPLARQILGLFWLKWPVRHCRFVTAVSEATKAEIARYTGCNPDKITVIPSAIPDHFQPVLQRFNAEKPRILHIGSAPNKNLRRHIEALRGLPCVLHLVAVLQPAEKKLLEDAGIEYECTPDLDDAAIVQAYTQCDLLLFASTLEGFGMPILEAQSVGRPVVTSNCSSMPEVAGAGACFVHPLETASIREGVLRVIRDAEYREMLVRCGFENSRRFRSEAVAEAYFQLYRQCGSGRQFAV